MPGTIIVGLQQGEEGTEKVTNLLAMQVTHVVRATKRGGALPAGVINPHAQCYIAGGCPIDPKLLIQEISRLEGDEIKIAERLHISPFASIINSEITIAELIRTEDRFGGLLRPLIHDVEGRIQSALLRDESVLFVGDASAAEVCLSAQVGPTRIDEVFGVFRAFPELDLCEVRQAAQRNGVQSLALTHLNELDECPEIQVCVGYSLDGEEIDKPPPLAEDLPRVEPLYETLPGWGCSTSEAKMVRSLPVEARTLIDLIEEVCNVSIGLISVGESFEETIEIDEEFLR